MDPGLAIVGAVSIVVAGMLALAWRMRGGVQRKRDALRLSPRIEHPIISQLRTAPIVLAALMLPVAVVLGPAIALDLARAHALAVVCTVVLFTPVALFAAIRVGEPFTTVGRIALEREEFVYERSGRRVSIALTTPFQLREAVVLPGRYTTGGRVETLVAVEQAGAEIVFRYPNLIGEQSLAPEGAVAPPFVGNLLGPEALVMHERLRAVLAERSHAVA